MTESVAQRLEKSSADILSIWEKRARAEILATEGKDSEVIQDELALFLKSLVHTLAMKNPMKSLTDEKAALNHGQQRAGLTNYTLIEIIEEYSLMRQVLIEILSRQGPLAEKDRAAIHLAVDTAMELATNEFAKAEQAKILLALAKAEQSNRELEQFAAIVAHDFRSPLASISGFAEVLRDDLSSSVSQDTEQALDFIEGAVSRLVNMVDGILSYAKLNGEKPQFQPVDCNTAVFAAVQNLQVQLTDSGGRTEHGGLPTLNGDLTLLTQLFQNLISNSLKFRGSVAPVVKVSAAPEGTEYWKFVVEDNGIGFDPDLRESIFGLYKKAHSASNYGGTGIGLATCRRVVELHGGKIWAESRPGEGSTFHFTLSRSANRQETAVKISSVNKLGSGSV